LLYDTDVYEESKRAIFATENKILELPSTAIFQEPEGIKELQSAEMELQERTLIEINVYTVTADVENMALLLSPQ
jgi:hypothetical protein